MTLGNTYFSQLFKEIMHTTQYKQVSVSPWARSDAEVMNKTLPCSELLRIVFVSQTGPQLLQGLEPQLILSDACRFPSEGQALQRCLINSDCKRSLTSLMRHQPSTLRLLHSGWLRLVPWLPSAWSLLGRQEMQPSV